MVRWLKNNFHYLGDFLTLEKEWQKFLQADRISEGEKKDWPKSLFNIKDSEQPLFTTENLHFTAGMLGNYWSEMEWMLRQGYHSPAHAGQMYPSCHFPSRVVMECSGPNTIPIAVSYTHLTLPTTPYV